MKNHLCVLFCLLLATRVVAMNEETYENSGSWIAFGYQKATYSYTDFTAKFFEDVAINGTSTGHLFEVRWGAFSDVNRTALGTLPGMTGTLLVGKFSKFAGTDLSEFYSADDVEGGGTFAVNMGFPWTLVELSFLRFGAGYGFEWGLERDIPVPASVGLSSEWTMFTSGFGALNLVLYPTGNPKHLKIDGLCELGTSSRGSFTRYRATLLLAFLSIGANYRFYDYSDSEVKGVKTDCGTVQEFRWSVGFCMQ
jgi:hypothetical protein